MFGGFFNGLFHNIDNVFTSPHHHAPPPPSNYKTPPASKRVLASLPQVKVTADDILEATNKECLICLEEQKIGSWACKLQCGHLFHKNCVAEWLEKHCTCPVCRFELETDDTAYESERKKRMKKRKLRLRMDEINNKSIAQLREISQNLNIDISGCIDKTEIVDKLVKSGGIEITEGMPPIEMTEEEFNSKTVSQLRYLLLSFGISDRDAIEKSELRSKLLASGRIVFKPVTKCDGTAEVVSSGSSGNVASGSSSYGDIPSSSGVKASAVSEDPVSSYDEVKNISKTEEMGMEDMSEGLQPFSTRGLAGSSRSSAGASAGASPSPTGDEPYLVLLSDLRTFSLAELQELCVRYSVSTVGCLEKAELVERLLDSGHIRLLDVQEQLAAVADNSINSSDDGSDSNNSNKDSKKSTPGESSRTSIEDSQMSFPPFGNPIVMEDTGIHTNNSNNQQCTNEANSAHMDVVHEAEESTTSEYPSTNNNNKVFTGRINAYDEPSPYSNSSNSDICSNTQNVHGQSQDTRLTLSMSLLAEMSIREVRSIMDAYNISSAGCLEKTDMIARMQQCSSIRIVN